jgi:hypothetical protein
MAVNLVESNSVEALERIAKLEDELAAAKALLEARPQEPTAEGSVIRFRKFGQSYTFAAVKVGVYAPTWYVTQDGGRTARQGVPPKTWDSLLDWIGERNFATIEVLG